MIAYFIGIFLITEVTDGQAAVFSTASWGQYA